MAIHHTAFQQLMFTLMYAWYVCMHAEVDPGYSERGSEHRSVSLMQGAWGTPDGRYRVFIIITPKS